MRGKPTKNQRALKGDDGKGKGKGCFKYNWELELENPEAFDGIEFRSNIQEGRSVVYDSEEYIDAKALTGGKLKDKYTPCGVPCLNATVIEYSYVNFCFHGSADLSDVKKFRFEYPGGSFEYPGDSFENSDGAYDCCEVEWYGDDGTVNNQCFVDTR